MPIKQAKELEKHPNNYELQIVGLIHDLGKVLFKFGEPNWAVVGDTYVVGYIPETIVYYETMKENLIITMLDITLQMEPIKRNVD